MLQGLQSLQPQHKCGPCRIDWIYWDGWLGSVPSTDCMDTGWSNQSYWSHQGGFEHGGGGRFSTPNISHSGPSNHIPSKHWAILLLQLFSFSHTHIPLYKHPPAKATLTLKPLPQLVLSHTHIKPTLPPSSLLSPFLFPKESGWKPKPGEGVFCRTGLIGIY